VRVRLVDREQPGRGTSFGNAGHIATEQVFPLASPEVVRGALRYLLDRESPLRIRPAYALAILPWLVRFAWASRRASFERGVAALSALQRTAANDLADLLELAGARRLLHLDGNLMLVERVESLAAATAEIGLMRARGVRADWLAADEVRGLVPELGVPVEGAWKFRDTGHVDDPYAVSAAFEKGIRVYGGEIDQADIVAIEGRGRGFAARASDGRSFEATHVVIACGARSKPLASHLGYPVPLDTERGYHITLPAARAEFRIPVSSFERKVIMTPMSIGTRMTGTVEFGGLDLAPDPHRFEILRRHMRALAPSLPTEGMSTWMGYRPSLPDHLPVLGRVPDGRNLFFAFGHQHLGLTLSGVSARIIADLTAGREPGVDLSPFRVDRF
jgi:glycine/D-amino acid oxidase-like deaminating enzyme